MKIEESRLIEFLGMIKLLNYTPGPLQVSKIGKTSYVNCELKPGINIISEFVTCGMDKNIFVATTKAIVEAIERNAFKEGKRAGIKACQTKRSDGFAAYPLFKDSTFTNSLNIARNNALCEAIERYVWANWWDDSSKGHSIVNGQNLIQSMPESREIWKHLNTIIDIESVKIVYPYINSELFNFCIVLIKIKDAGYVTGGSCELIKSDTSPLIRSIYEASRHLIAYMKAQKCNLHPISFYEKRLLFFASGKGNKIVQNRLSKLSNNSISLPALEVDEEVQHSMRGAVICYRVLFQNQPDFLGGKLERLCI